MVRDKKKSKSNADPSRYIRMTRLGKVTIYRRGHNYWLYFRDSGKTIRKRIDGNLATAKATASHVNVYLEQRRPSPFDFASRPIGKVTEEFLDHCRLGRGLRVRTLRRYEAALGHFKEFIETKPHIRNVDQVRADTVDEFVRYLSQKQRVRSGERNGPKGNYTRSGIAFVLSTCRTLFNYARKRRLLSPYEENPFSSFPIDKLRTREPSQVELLASEQVKEFFQACDAWQFPLFFILSLYGLRVGELSHLLISDVNLAKEQFTIQSKPFLLWYVKSNRQRVLPIIPAVRPLFESQIGDRGEGFVFLSRVHGDGRRTVPPFLNRTELEAYVAEHMSSLKAGNSIEADKKQFNFVRRIMHQLGKAREDRVREEFIQVTSKIRRPEVTTVHSLRHLFATLAEENGLNPLTVQTILGHSRLEMTRHYTHTGLEAKKAALEDFLQGKCDLDNIVRARYGSENAS